MLCNAKNREQERKDHDPADPELPLRLTEELKFNLTESYLRIDKVTDVSVMLLGCECTARG